MDSLPDEFLLHFTSGPSIIINTADTRVMGLPARYVAHIDIDQTVLATHDYDKAAVAACEYCADVFGKGYP